MFSLTIGSSPSRTPLQAWRLCLDLFLNLSTALTGSVLLYLGAICLATIASAAITFNEGFEGGAAGWAADNSGPWRQAPANAFELTSGAREGSKAVRFLPKTGSVRSEFTINGGLGAFNWGTEYWEGFSIRVVAPLDGFGIIFQHHAVPARVNGRVEWNVSAGENSFTLKTRGNNFIIYTATVADNVDGTDIIESTGVTRRRAQTGAATWGTAATEPIPFVPGRWYDFVLHFRLATDATGIMQVWTREGEAPGAPWVNRVNVTAGVTVYKYDSGKTASSGKTPVGDHRDGLPKCPETFQKIGLYYGGNITTGEVCYDSFRIWAGPGGSIGAVAPGGGTAPLPPSLSSATTIPTGQINLTRIDSTNNETGIEAGRDRDNGFPVPTMCPAPAPPAGA